MLITAPTQEDESFSGIESTNPLESSPTETLDMSRHGGSGDYLHEEGFSDVEVYKAMQSGSMPWDEKPMFAPDSVSFADSFSAGVVGTASSVVKSARGFGLISKETEYKGLRSLSRYRTDLVGTETDAYYEKFRSDDLGEWFKYRLGTGVGQMAPTIALTMATGGLARGLNLGAKAAQALIGTTQFSGTFLRIFGDELETMMRETNPDTPVAVKWGAAFASALAQSGIESAFGPERFARDAAKLITYRSVADMMKNEFGEKALAEIGQSWLKSSLKIPASGITEGLEEIGQKWTSDLAIKALNPDHRMTELSELLTTEFAGAVPAGMFFGGMSAITTEYKKYVARSIADIKEDQIQKMVQKFPQDDMIRLNTETERLRTELAGLSNVDEKSIGITVDHLTRISLGISAGTGEDPSVILKTFKTRFTERNLTVNEFIKYDRMSSEEKLTWLTDNDILRDSDAAIDAAEVEQIEDMALNQSEQIAKTYSDGLAGIKAIYADALRGETAIKLADGTPIAVNEWIDARSLPPSMFRALYVEQGMAGNEGQFFDEARNEILIPESLEAFVGEPEVAPVEPEAKSGVVPTEQAESEIAESSVTDFIRRKALASIMLSENEMRIRLSNEADEILKRSGQALNQTTGKGIIEGARVVMPGQPQAYIVVKEEPRQDIDQPDESFVTIRNERTDEIQENVLVSELVVVKPKKVKEAINARERIKSVSEEATLTEKQKSVRNSNEEAKAEKKRRAQVVDESLALEEFQSSNKRIKMPNSNDPLYAEIWGVRGKKGRISDAGAIPRSRLKKDALITWEDALDDAKRLGLVPDEAQSPTDLASLWEKPRTVGEVEDAAMLIDDSQISGYAYDSFVEHIQAGNKPSQAEIDEFSDEWVAALESSNISENSLTEVETDEITDEDISFEVNEFDPQSVIKGVSPSGQTEFLGQDEGGFQLTGEEGIDQERIAQENANAQAAQEAADAAQDELFGEDEGVPRGTTEPTPEEPALAEVSPLNATYFTHNQTAVFFKSADPSTVIHEFMHHIRTNKFLPVAMNDELLAASGQTEWNREAEEFVANSVLAYLDRGELPANVTAGWLNSVKYVREVLTKYADKTIKADWKLNKATSALFEKILAKSDYSIMSEKDAGVLADAVDLSMKTDDSLNSAQTHLPLLANTSKKRFHIALKNYDEITGESGRDALRSAGKPSYLTVQNARANGLFDEDGMNDDQVQDAIDFFDTNPMVYAAKKKQIAESIKNRTKELARLERLNPTELKQLLDARRAEALADAAKVTEGSQAMPETAEMKSHAYGANRWYDKTRRGATIIAENMTNPRNLLEFMDMQNPDGKYTKIMFEKLNNADREGANRYNNSSEFIGKLAQQYGGIPDNLHESIDIKDGNTTKSFTLSELAAIYMYTEGGNVDTKTAKKLMANHPDVTPGVVRYATERIQGDTKAIAYIKAIQGYMRHVWPSLEATVKSVTGKPLGNRGTWYLPMVRDDNSVVENDMLGILESLSPIKAERVDIQRSPDAIKKQSQEEFGGVKLNLNSLNIFLRYHQSAENYIAKAETIQELMWMMNDKALSKEIVDRFGPHTYDALTEMFTRELSSSGRLTPYGKGEVELQSIRRNAYPAMLGFSPFVPIRQTISALNGMAETEIVGGFSNFIKTFHYALGTTKKGKIKWTMEGNKDYNKMIAESPKMKYRALTGMTDPGFEVFAQQRFESQLSGQAKKSKNVNIMARGMDNIRLFDMITVTSVYTTAKNIAIAEGKRGLEAIKYAEKIVEKTQPQTTITDRNLLQTSNEYWKSGLMFTGQRFVNQNYYVHDIIMPLFYAHKKGGSVGMAKAMWDVKRKVLLAVVLPSMALGMIARRRWYKEPKEFWLDLMIYPLSVIPFVGAGMSNKIQGFDGDVYSAVWSSLATATSDVFAEHMSGDKSFANVEDVWDDATALREVITTLLGQPNYLFRVIERSFEHMAANGVDPVTIEQLRKVFGAEAKEMKK